MKYLFFFFVIAISKLQAVACTDTIVVDKDPRLDIIVAKQAMINKRSAQLTSSGLYKGYRLQVTSTVNREDAFKIKTALLNRFPEQKTYLIFQSPNFKVRIGNFLKREEADKFRKQLTKQLPQAAYIVEDTIEYTPQEDDLQN